ncbi:Non-heme dioxygenase N-terminal domain containing protein [Trema orientale]|uniref:Non-heme dioxygenase N-terminal domain containing protein n=1 Tax=Trema orientale TaxID=63057 RepID=A0A2P5CIZ9_TREOI|nr:Non-heme dioxygenase N-terminal domain containing protein [Trema orientale]
MGSKVGEGSFNMGLGWGKSIPVPSVQEIVRNDSQYVPERYIKDYEDRPFLDSSATFRSNLPNIPVIDFSLLINGDAEQLNKLDCACKEWGFFLIINHTVAEEVLSNVKAAAARFFDLSLEEKKKYSMVENDVQGYGQMFVVSEEQKLDWNDILFLRTRPTEYRNMKYWPIELPGFNIHRAATNANKARMSIATALYPDDEAEVGPVESMMQDRPRMYREVKAIDYIRYRLGNKLKGNAAINFLKSRNNA